MLAIANFYLMIPHRRGFVNPFLQKKGGRPAPLPRKGHFTCCWVIQWMLPPP